MDRNEPVYRVLSEIYRETHKKPTITLYRPYAAEDANLPKAKEVVSKYGSSQAFTDAFLAVYHENNDHIEVPNYLLGCLVGRCKVVRRKNGYTFLRFTSTDSDQIDAMIKFVHNWSTVDARKDATLYELRIADYDLIAALEHLDFFENPPFIPDVDFVRGYCDAHSAVRFYESTRKNELVRLTLSGSLVPQVHDYLVAMGANDTRVIKEGTTLRMHIQSKSLRRIREQLYPAGCICNVRKRMQIYRA